MSATQDLLRRLAAGDEPSLQALLSPPLAGGAGGSCLDRGTRALVELAALIALDAPTSSLRWAADRAGATGAGDEALVQVLLTAGTAAGTVQAASSASRLALALDLDVAYDG